MYFVYFKANADEKRKKRKKLNNKPKQKQNQPLCGFGASDWCFASYAHGYW